MFARIYRTLMSQAQAISYAEVYWLLAIVSVLKFFLSFLLAKSEPRRSHGSPWTSLVCRSPLGDTAASLLSRHQDLWCSCT